MDEAQDGPHACNERTIDFTGDPVATEARCSCGRVWELRFSEEGKPLGWRVTQYGRAGA